MYKVLIPVDTDESRARAQARFVASLPDAADSVEAIVLFVFDAEGDVSPGDPQPIRSAQQIASVRRARELLETRGVQVQTIDESGEAAEDILREAEAFDVDLIVLGTRKRTAVGKPIFGSITQSIIRATDRPVVITDENRP